MKQDDVGDVDVDYLPVVEKLIEEVDEVGEVPESARLHLRFDPNIGPELTGNVEGLRYLGALLAELASHGVERHIPSAFV